MLKFNRLRVFVISSQIETNTNTNTNTKYKCKYRRIEMNGTSTQPVEPSRPIQNTDSSVEKIPRQTCKNMLCSKTGGMDLAKAIISFIVPFMAGFLFIDC